MRPTPRGPIRRWRLPALAVTAAVIVGVVACDGPGDEAATAHHAIGPSVLASPAGSADGARS